MQLKSLATEQVANKLDVESSWSISTVDTDCLTCTSSVPPTPIVELGTDFAFDVEHLPIETILGVEEVVVDSTVIDARKETHIDKPVLSEAVLDALDDHGVSDELLEAWTAREKKALSPPSRGGACGDALPPLLRHTALSFLCFNAKPATQGSEGVSFFEATQLLDVFHLKTSDHPNAAQLNIQNLPMTCAAILSLLQKMDVITAEPVDPFCAEGICIFANHLKSLGYHMVNDQVTCEMINDEELRVLQAIQWQLKVPTVESWLNTFVTRLSVLSHGLLSLKEVWQQCLCGAQVVTMQQALTMDRPPRKLAVGFLGIGLAGAQLLPVEALRPTKLSSAQWMQLYKDIRPQELQPQCVLPDQHVQSLLEVLKEAVQVDFAEINECCHLAALAMKAGLRV